MFSTSRQENYAVNLLLMLFFQVNVAVSKQDINNKLRRKYEKDFQGK